MKQNKKIAAGAVVTGFFAIGITGVWLNQRPAEVITAGRPLHEAARLLEERYRTPVTYEETMWLWDGDKETTPIRLGLYPKQRTFSLPGGLNPDQTPVLNETVLEAVLDAYHRQTDGPQFRLFTSTWGLHIVPTRAHGVSGQLVDTHSVLDTYIDLPIESRTPAEHFRALCEAVTKASGVIVKPFAPWLDQFFAPNGIAPPRRPLTETEKQDASFAWGAIAPARDALISLAELSATTLTWKLKCSAEPWDQNCVLNFMPIQFTVTEPDGTVGINNVTYDRSKKPLVHKQ